ncbi:MAG TPA: calcium/sodium antiporter [Longimicrobiaceae bacterium]|nr:calcium/sodium antiporter [Longimicrobiaceae bacterium]
MSPLTMVLFVLGIGILVAGAEVLVRGASRLAAALGISPLVIGLTVVAFGTSSPELAVSVQSALSGETSLAVGNVVGSNIFNVLFILGLSAAVTPLVVAQQLVRLDVPLMIAASFALLLLALDGALGRLDGALLFGGVVAYTTFLVRQSRRETAAVRAEYEEEFGEARVGAASWLRNVALVVGGLLMLVVGSRWLVAGAVEVATALGVSELVIGLTIVAVGTSLPEVATSLMASLRGERDIAVGNVVGSNLFNLLAVLGLSGIVAPGGIGVDPAALRFDIPVMIAVAVACLPVFAGQVITRWQGLLFLGYYVAYAAYLVLAATEHDALPAYSTVMTLFVLPLTVATLVIVGIRALRSHRRGEVTAPLG